MISENIINDRDVAHAIALGRQDVQKAHEELVRQQNALQRLNKIREARLNRPGIEQQLTRSILGMAKRLGGFDKIGFEHTIDLIKVRDDKTGKFVAQYLPITGWVDPNGNRQIVKMITRAHLYREIGPFNKPDTPDDVAQRPGKEILHTGESGCSMHDTPDRRRGRIEALRMLNQWMVKKSRGAGTRVRQQRADIKRKGK